MTVRATRNPFTLRASELIESDGTFLRLFGPGVLDLLQAEEVWNRVQPIQSAPGGGKTSLFRLFTPACLLMLYDSRATAEEFKDLNRRLKEMAAISEDGPSVLGVMISGVSKDADLESLALDQARKNRLFFSLLNSRITIAALRSALELKKLSFPDDLPRLFIQRPKVSDFPSSIPVPCKGDILLEWASDSEKQISRYIDSFAPNITDPFLGYDTLYCLYLLQSDCIYLDGQSVAPRTLLMIDNVERLTKTQRTNLFDALVNLRVPIGVWLAERLEALNPRELFGAEVGREYEEPIVLEEFWRNESSKYEQVIENIADRRAKLNPDIQMGPFEACLQNSLDGIEWKERYLKAIEAVSFRVREKTRNTRRYDKWISKGEVQEGTPREKAISWRVLEIKIERDKKKAQRQLIDSPLPEEDLEIKVEAATREAAELFLAREFYLPYYFGFQNLVKLSTSNIEQFLVFASDLFEEVISAKLLKQSTSLSPSRQESILTKAAKQLWDAIPFSSPNGRDIVRLLERIGEMCLTETTKPNAPYAPGVTGIALSMKDRDRLIASPSQEMQSEMAKLSGVLSSCISNNFLLMHSGVHQGQKGGTTWMVLYLNRWLCLHFGLPFQYGGWRPIKIIELIKYICSEPQKKDKVGVLSR
jgi:hypothetical protein